MIDVGAIYKAAGMDPQTGMYPQHPCKQCGKPLNADGGHPAELYAGTYTGLCYGCEHGGAYRVQLARDWAEVWSFPPHCPSWRRDREEFIGYPGCTQCGGRGRIMVSRGDPMGGPYSTQCKSCSERFYNDPLRHAASERLQAAYTEAEAMWQAALKAEKRRLGFKARQQWVPDELWAGELRALILAAFDEVKAEFDAWKKEWFVWE